MSIVVVVDNADLTTVPQPHVRGREGLTFTFNFRGHLVDYSLLALRLNQLNSVKLIRAFTPHYRESYTLSSITKNCSVTVRCTGNYSHAYDYSIFKSTGGAVRPRRAKLILVNTFYSIRRFII